MKAEQLTREYQAAGDMDGPLLRAGDAAHGLLLAAEASEKNPLLGYLLRQQVEKHRDEWLKAMPEKARPQVVPILDAFIHGANAETLKQLIAKNSTFSLAKATPLKDVDLDDKDRAENVKQVKRLVEAGKGTDGFLRDGDYSIHYWYFPAQEGKQTLLFSNGRNATMLSSANLILKAVEEGYGFIQYEYPQNGESKGELSENGYYHATNLMYEFLTKTQGIPAEQIIDLGYSMGTNLASRLASLHPEVKTIALISPPEGFAKVYDEVIARHKGTLAAKLAVNSEILDAFNTAKLFEDGKIKGKTILIVYGEKDDYVLPKETITLAKLAEKHNTVIYVPIPGEGHSSIRSTPGSLDLIFKLMKHHLLVQE